MPNRIGSMPGASLALACFVIAFAMRAAAADANQTVNFNIPAQSLTTALQAFGVQASRQILFTPKLAAGKQARSVVGELPVETALARLLEGSGLTFRNTNGTLLIVESVAADATQGRSAGAADPPPEAGNETPAAADEIIVTGTRQTSRTVNTSLAPVDIISAADLEKSGNESVRDLIAATTPSANVSSSGAGASFTIKTLSLRGLSSDQTLVLVNGKRRHDTSIMFINGTTQNGQSPADLDLIPTSAIDHIEVLRDGASVQYGSDALAGVVNIILKKDYGGGASLTGGATAAGDGVKGDALLDQGWSIGNGGTLHLSADVSDQGRTIRGGPYTGRLYPLIDGEPDPREATTDRYINKPGQPKVMRYDAAYDLALPLSDRVQLYSFSTAAYRDSNSWLTYRNPASVSNVLAVYPNGYIPRLDLQDVDYQAAVGVKGTAFWDIHWDLSTTYGEDQVNYRESSALNLSYGPASPTNFYIGATDFREWTTNLDLNRNFEIGLTAPLFAAVGAEYRENHYKILPGDVASYANGGVGVVSGSQGVTGFPPGLSGAWSRNNKSAYIDLEQTIARRLDLSAAARYEDYSDFGNTTNEKGSFRFEPIDNYAIRGTVSTGFRAPTLAQEHYASSSTIGVTVPGFTSVVPYPVQTLPPDSAAARALGATPLRPEKSRNYSLGVIAQPIPNLNLSVDAYEIKITDRILLSATLLGGPVSGALAAAGLNPEQGGFFFTNAADTTTKGLDLVTSYLSRFDGLGSFRWGFDANFNHTKFDRIESPPPALAAAGLVLIDHQRQGDFTLGTPSNKLICDVDWTLGNVETFLRATRYGPVTAVNDNPALNAEAGSKLIVDLNVSYHFTDHFNSTIGADNVFNTHPTIVIAADQANGAQYYNAYSPFGISGGFYYARLSYKF
jgi:iron complex outermembrane receptor protein